MISAGRSSKVSGRFYLMELYDILFFDCICFAAQLLPHFYPEPKGVVVPHMFGYNKKHIAFYSVYPLKCCNRFVLYPFVLKLEYAPNDG